MSAGAGHALCHTCALVVRLPAEATGRLLCPRCHAAIHRRKPNSLSRTWALLVAAAICYVPANVYPVMTVTSLGASQSDTIMSGVLYLAHNGMWPLAAIVFIASVIVPVAKVVALAALAISVQRASDWRPRDRARLYRIVEAIGRWSMVDVYVVTILVALVHLGSLASVEAEIGGFFFGAVVVLTMFAASSFDPRLIWDRLADDARRPAERAPEDRVARNRGTGIGAGVPDVG